VRNEGGAARALSEGAAHLYPTAPSDPATGRAKATACFLVSHAPCGQTREASASSSSLFRATSRRLTSPGAWAELHCAQWPVAALLAHSFLSHAPTARHTRTKRPLSGRRAAARSFGTWARSAQVCRSCPNLQLREVSRTIRRRSRRVCRASFGSGRRKAFTLSRCAPPRFQSEAVLAVWASPRRLVNVNR
jgi:hypothetical protein